MKQENDSNSFVERYFKLSSYDKCDQLKPLEWAEQLALRNMVLWSSHTLRKASQSDQHSSDYINKLKRVALDLLARPLERNSLEAMQQPPSSPYVYDTLIIEILTGYHDCREIDEFDYAEKFFFEHYGKVLEQDSDKNKAEYIKEQDWPEILEGSFNEIARYESERTMLVSVDLSAPDKLLLSEFKKWLTKARLSTSKTLNHSKWSKKAFTEADFKKWSRLKVLAYIDLYICDAVFGESLTMYQIGQLLFPNTDSSHADDADPSERVRKVVRPLAANLLKPESIDSLRAFSKQSK